MERRYALCLYGKFNNRFDKKAGLKGFQYIKAKLLDEYDFDIFIYSTDLENEREIRKCYNEEATKIEFSSTPNWNEKIKEEGIRPLEFERIEESRNLENSFNFLKSRSNSINLALKHATKNGKYDWIVTARFDLAQIDKHNSYQPFRVSEIGFNPKLENRYVYSALWNQTNNGLADQWFYSSQENMAKIAEMGDRCVHYFKPESDYQKILESGIPYTSVNDEFSNELFRKGKKDSPELLKISRSKGLNNHLIHKYFFFESGLLDAVRFTADIPGVARVMYTHTDYSDIWPVYFAQTIKFGNLFKKNYVLVNQFDSRIPNYFEQVIYDDRQSYSDRLLVGLKKIQEDRIFLEHEDMFLYDVPEVTQLIEYANCLKRNKVDFFNFNRFDVIKLLDAGRYFSTKVRKKNIKSLRRISRFSPWIFSIQPSFWLRDSLISLLEENKGLGIWDLENAAQRSIKKIGFRSATVKGDKGKRGLSHFDSSIYPFIATAVVKGKWNFSEYQEELKYILEESNISAHTRGFV